MGALGLLCQPVLDMRCCLGQHVCPCLSHQWPASAAELGAIHCRGGHMLRCWAMGDKWPWTHQTTQASWPGRARRQRAGLAWVVAPQPHAGPPPTCPEVVLHTQSSPRLLLHSLTISAAISPLCPSSGTASATVTPSKSTNTSTAGKEQKPSVTPL